MSNRQTAQENLDPEDVSILDADQDADEDLGANDSSSDYNPSDDESESESEYEPAPRPRTTYPAGFPHKLGEMIDCIPIGMERNGQNLRLLIVETLVKNFTDDTLRIIETVRSAAPHEILDHFACIIIYLSAALSVVRPGEQIALCHNHFRRLTYMIVWSRVATWLASMGDDQTHYRLGLLFTLESLPHRLLHHITLVSRPSAEQGIGITVTDCDCSSAVVAESIQRAQLRRYLELRGAFPQGPSAVVSQRIVQHVQTFIASLPVVSRSELEANE